MLVKIGLTSLEQYALIAAVMVSTRHTQVEHASSTSIDVACTNDHRAERYVIDIKTSHWSLAIFRFYRTFYASGLTVVMGA